MKNYTDEVVAACISNLLARLDEVYGEGMHWYGQTPDWYVCAAMVSCDIEDTNGEASRYILKEAEERKENDSSDSTHS
jgi:hypothetical protein